MSEENAYQNADSAPYFEAAAKGSLLLQRCRNCGRSQFPPSQLCAACWSDELEWVQSPGKGTIESFTIVHRAPTEKLRAHTPYVIAAILLEDGVRMITNVVGEGSRDASIGDSVSVTFESDSDGNVLPQFRLA